MPLPTGPAVAFLFTDIEGSTRLEQTVGSEAWARIVARHDELLRRAIEDGDGVVVKTEGDAFFAAFDDPGAVVQAAAAAQRAVANEAWPEACELRVRMGAHLGEGRLRHRSGPDEPEDYVGIDVNYAARIAAAANGGQVVLSDRLRAALPSDLDGGTSLVDEGLRAVKDFEEPQRLYRLLVAGAADDDRPLRTLDVPTNLPGEMTTLVGREGEVASLRQLLDSTRLLTLTGPGGSGKTRLALAVAADVRPRFAHGVWFVDLAAVTDATLLPARIAVALGVRESKEKPVEQALRDHLRDRLVLLVLDNLEQLLPDAATEVGILLREGPQLRCLVTSRELLRIAGERGHPVPPLDVEAGIELFEARAASHRPDLALSDESRATIRAICERLGGLPLAIELAAARTRVMSPSLILQRLSSSLDLAAGARDVPERQRTLRGAIAWSHDLLTDPERTLFRRLSVFAGGWTAESAFAVADPDGTLGIDVLAGLESLADKSLVRIDFADANGERTDEPRFDLHPLLREFAGEQLDASGERAELERRQAHAVLEIAEQAGMDILGPSSVAVIRRLDREAHNVRAAVDWSLGTGGDPDVGLRILAATWRWFQQRGQLREGRALLAQLLAKPWTDVRIRLGALSAEGGLAYWMDDFEGARVAYGERLDLAESTGDARLIADAHYDIGFLSVVGNDAEGVRRHEGRALEIYRELGVEDAALRARQALVLGEFLSGEYERARALTQQDLADFDAQGSPYLVADGQTLLSAIDFKFGDAAAAWGHLQDSLTFFSGNDNSSGIARAIGMAALVQLEYGDAELGARIAGATYELVRSKGVMLAPVKVLHLREPSQLARERLGDERAAELLADGATTPLDEVIAQVLASPFAVVART